MRNAILQKLYSRLACPVTGGELTILPTVLSGSDVKEGLLQSGAGTVGSVRNFKPDFVRKDAANVGQVKNDSTVPVWIHQDAAELSPDWAVVNDFWRLFPADACLRIDHPRAVRVKLVAHPSAGMVSINGEVLDLYHPSSAIPLVHECDGPIEICPLNEKNPKSRNTQILLESIDLQTENVEPAGYRRIPRNRARPFRNRAMQLLEDVPADGFMIDIGGGRRMLDDDRYFSMEYDLFDEADLYGDAQALPFKDNSIDFIHSTAVFEHLPFPERAAQEIHRVLKPGGKAYVVTAFMQPVHSEPLHFYNASVFGIENWFRDFAERRVSFGGSFTETLMTLAKSATKGARNADLSKLKVALDELQSLVTPEAYMHIASETRIEVTKSS